MSGNLIYRFHPDTSNVYYYFEVTLAEPVEFKTINREALAEALQSGTTTEKAEKTYTIRSWAMPDPRNLQVVDRGILSELFSRSNIQTQIALIAADFFADQKVSGEDLGKLQNLLLGITEELTSNFERNYDPMLASVFTVPNIDFDSQSLWVANIEDIDDGKYNLDACVYDADGNLVDVISEDFTVDATAPAATLNIDTADAKTTGYGNKAGVFVTTAEEEREPAFPVLLNISSELDPGDVLGPDKAYLIYQIIELDADGNPESTWLPLTVENSMLASDLWDLAREQLKDYPDPIVSTAAALPLNQFLETLSALLTPTAIVGAANTNPTVKAVLQFLGIEQPTEAQTKLLRELIGVAVADLNSIPLTDDESRAMTIPLFYREAGDYGIRAMGIDNLFNVGSHVKPTRVRVVMPEWDRTRITMASLGDINHNSKADPYESGMSGKAKIFRNATEVTFTVAVKDDGRSKGKHPADIMVQYQDANGDWQTIGKLELAEGADTITDPPTVTHNFTDFDDLVSAGDVVRLRTVTTNGLQLDDTSEEFTLVIDDDVHPVDPKVLVVDLNDDSIVMTNPDSGAPKGTIELIAYTPRRTEPATANIRVEAKRMNDDAWTDIGTVELTDPDGMPGTDTAAITFNGKALADVYVDDDLHIQNSGSYLKWVITVDTTTLADTIDMGNLAAAHAASNPDGTSYTKLDKNRYMVRSYAVGDDGNDISDAVEGETYTDTFSVDNVDDVAPLGPTNIVATSIDAVNPTFTDNGDGTYTVGSLVDKYDPEVNSPVVTFTITPTARRNTYKSVQLITTLPERAIIGKITETVERSETVEGSGVFTVTVDVGTLDNDTYLEDEYIENADKNIYNPEGAPFEFELHALAYDTDMDRKKRNQTHDRDADGAIIETVDNKITVNVQNTYRPDPGVLAVAVVNSDGMVNPDSGAPQGELTFDVYTHGITSAPTEGIRVEVKRPNDKTWERITGTAEASELVGVSEVPVADLADIANDNAGIENVGVLGALVDISEAESKVKGEGESPASLMKWSYVVDTRALALEDTVTAENTIKLDDTIERHKEDEPYHPSERDVSLDKNQYTVRVYALTPKNKAQVEYPKRDEYLERRGVETTFSLDNDDDVPPLGPTNITDIVDAAGSIEANEDGSYNVSLIADAPALSTDLTFTIQPTAKEITYAGGKIRLVQTDADRMETIFEADLADGQNHY